MPYRTFCQFPQFQFSAVKLQKKLILQTFLGKNIFKTYIFSLKVRDFFHSQNCHFVRYSNAFKHLFHKKKIITLLIIKKSQLLKLALFFIFS